MTRPPADGRPNATGPPDRQTLQLLERQLSTDELVKEAHFVPDPYEPRLLRVRLDSTQYPEAVVSVRLDIRWFTTGDFSIHYVEDYETNGQWECRWDRHPNSHNSRLHFHQPPTATEVTDLSLPSQHPLEVYATVFTAIEHRLETLWSTQ